MKLSTSQAVKALLVFFGSLVLTACTKDANKQTLNPLLRDSNEIISTRPQNSKHFLGILKLKSPSLLQSAKRVDGKPVIDQELLKAILAEQEETLTALRNLSPEIQVMYRYKMVLNGIAIVAPLELQDKIKALAQIAYAEKVGTFERPILDLRWNTDLKKAILERNSSKFIGAETLNKNGITGKGVRVAIVDTGIDYTHAMFKGLGTEEAFKAINPAGEAVGFPNEKVVGGIDLVGTDYDAANPEFSHRIPKPDMNPIDEGGHGTHVAGTVAGLGDGVTSYNGVAPDADLYAVKVFGADGSTSDSVVIAALEYSADPNGDGDVKDRLDVVNMSLGSPYGNPHILYSEAIKNLVNGGVVVVASGGNSGHTNYIVGSPGTASEALSVAASVDDGDHNWKFGASKIHLGTETLLVEAIEAATTKKIEEAGNVTGELVYIGLANEELTAEQKAAVQGKVAFIDRGVVTFNDKVKRAAEAGAIGVVVGNNSDGNPISMGTTDKFEIPAIMITKSAATKVKEALKTTVVTIEFQAPEKIEKPELIDTLTDFSSKGPRSFDGQIKPEISAPGNNVISAKMGGGKEIVQMSGTSMAAPHMAGVVALIIQAKPDLSAEQVKNIAMGTAKSIGDKGVEYPVSMQGAGRVQADRAAYSNFVAAESSFGIGEMAIENKKTYRKTVNLTNLSEKEQTLAVVFEGSEFVTMSAPASVTVAANSTASIPVTFTFDATKMKEESVREMDGFIKFKLGTEEVYRIPVLAVAHRLSAIKASDLTIQASSGLDAAGAAATLKLTNANKNAGEALLFNLLGKDDRKPLANSYMSAECDLQFAGYRIVTKKNQQDQDEDVIQFAVKTYKPMTTWNTCDISVLIDSNGDGVPEQELLGATMETIPNQLTKEFASTLLDAAKARALRKAFEDEVAKIKDDPKKLQEIKDKEKYDEAIIDQRELKQYNNSTVVVLEAAVSQLAKTANGSLAFKIAVSHNDSSTVQWDDYLGKANRQISLNKNDQSFVALPEVLAVKGSETLNIELTKGAGTENLLVLLPQNKFSFSDATTDAQAQIVKPKYQ